MTENIFSGRIIYLSAGIFTVCDGDRTIKCRGCGRFRNEEISPIVGDNVICTVESDDSGMIKEILPRKNRLVRPKVANVDRLIIVVSASKPAADMVLVDKLLIFCSVHGIVPVICINKGDDDIDNAEDICRQYALSGTEVFISSAKDGNFGKLPSVLSSGISVFAGQSGVGKTTLASLLCESYNGTSGSLSSKINRGKQTTRDTILVLTKFGGYIADTPGFSLFDAPDEMEPGKLKSYYAEFVPFEDKCRFNGCVHINEPDCAVKSAVNEKKIDSRRYDRYKILYGYFAEKQKHKY